MQLNYTKYKRWAIYLLIIALILLILFVLIGFVFHYQKWLPATFISYNHNGIVVFQNKNDYTNWLEKHYVYAECISDNQIYKFKVLESKFFNNQSIESNLAIWVDVPRINAFSLKTNCQVSIYESSVPWLIHFFKSLFYKTNLMI